MVRKPYLWQHPDGRWYLRIKGKYHPLRSTDGRWLEPGTQEGDAAYWEIRSGKRAAARTSWKALIASYRASERYTKRKPRTKRDYDQVMDYLLEKIGGKDCTRLIRKDVIEAQKANAHRTRFANYIPQVMSVLCEHAIDLGWRADNPAKGVLRLETPEERQQEHEPWPDWAVLRFRQAAAPIPRLIFELGVGTVQRPSDLLAFRWSDYDGTSLRITQGKTDADLWLPCTPDLKAALDRAPKKGLTILTKRDGSPMTYKAMSDAMRKERKRLGVEAYDLHALRYRGVMELAWGGCDDDEIASYSGHASKDMIRLYAGKARQMMRAHQAHAKGRGTEQDWNVKVIRPVIRGGGAVDEGGANG